MEYLFTLLYLLKVKKISRYRVMLDMYIFTLTNEVEVVYWFHFACPFVHQSLRPSVCLSVDQIVSALILARSSSYLQILSINFWWCAASRFILQKFQSLNFCLTFLIHDLAHHVLASSVYEMYEDFACHISFLVWKYPPWLRCVGYNINYYISLDMCIIT